MVIQSQVTCFSWKETLRLGVAVQREADGLWRRDGRGIVGRPNGR